MYPHWFVVRVRYAGLARPWHATGTGYVLFTQAAQGAAWKNVLEPYLLTGSGPALGPRDLHLLAGGRREGLWRRLGAQVRMPAIDGT